MRNTNHIIEKLGFKHQWCYFHAVQNFNKIIKKHIKENELTDDDIDKIRKEKLELFSLFESESFKVARREFDKILNRIEDYIKGYSTILSLIISCHILKHSFAFLEDENIERTSSKIENVFQMTFPKRVKRIYED